MNDDITQTVDARGPGPDTSVWHNVGGSEPGGKPTRIGKWTFGTKMVRDVVVEHLEGRVLNACAGKTDLSDHVRGPTIIRNDIDEDIPADSHHDVLTIDDHYEPESFDVIILDPPFDPGRDDSLYQGMHAVSYGAARDAVAPLVKPGGIAIELGWNSWSFGGMFGWEWAGHHLYRQASFKGDIHLCIGRKMQTALDDHAEGDE